MSKGAVLLRERIRAVLSDTDWDQFNSGKTLVPSIEVRAELERALKKTDKMIDAIMADTIGDKE